MDPFTHVGTDVIAPKKKKQKSVKDSIRRVMGVM
jgi:hypothetical protein